jgi:predicted dehydrogenase
MKFLIAGLGSIGRRHLRNLQALGEKDIILYRTHSSTLPDDEIAAFPVETDLQAALAHKPDAVIIANPTALHLNVAIPAAEAGCYLLIEKPVSDSPKRIDELKAALKHGGGKVLVGFQFRFHPTLRKVAEWLRTEQIGKPLTFHAEWGEYLPRFHPWEDYRKSYAARSDLGGGVVRTLSHPIDYLRMLLGEVAALWAFTGKTSDLEIDVEDTAEIGLKFALGTVGTLHLDYYRRPTQHKLEIVGSKGLIEWSNTTNVARLYRAELEAWESCLAPDKFERNDMFLSEMSHFIQVARGEIEPVCTLEDGLRVQELVQAIYDSADRYAIAR